MATPTMKDRTGVMGMTGPAMTSMPGMGLGMPMNVGMPMGMGMGMGMNTMPGMGMGMGQAPGMMMVPKGSITVERCDGGMMMNCVCDDAMSAGMVQSLCSMLAGGLCTCCVTMNGMMVSCCSMAMAHCRCEMTADGCKITCTSGDAACMAMIQACCDSLAALMKAGCQMCLCLGGTPVCCC